MSALSFPTLSSKCILGWGGGHIPAKAVASLLAGNPTGPLISAPPDMEFPPLHLFQGAEAFGDPKGQGDLGKTEEDVRVFTWARAEAEVDMPKIKTTGSSAWFYRTSFPHCVHFIQFLHAKEIACSCECQDISRRKYEEAC